MPNINLTPLINAIICVLAAIVTYRLIPLIKANTTNEQQKQLRAAVKVAVYAAEQIYGAGHGEEKLNDALKWLKLQGFDVDRTEIEAAVYELLNEPSISVDTVNLSTDGRKVDIKTEKTAE